MAIRLCTIGGSLSQMRRGPQADGGHAEQNSTDIFTYLGSGKEKPALMGGTGHNFRGLTWVVAARATALAAGYMPCRCSPS